MRRSIAALVIGMSIAPQLVAAQSVAPGTRVRVTHPGEGKRTGTFVSLTDDTLELRFEGRSEPSRLPLDQVTQLEVSHGKQRHLMRGAGIGFLVGGALGAATGAAAGSDCAPNEFMCPGAGGGAIIGGVFIGTFGGILGLVAGVIPSEKWERVVLQPRRISLDAAPSGRGARVGLSFAF